MDDDIYRRVDAYLLPPLLVNQVQAIYNLIDFPAQVNADLVIDRVQPKQTSANSLSTSNESHDEHVGIDKRLRIRSISHHSKQNESYDIHDHHRRLQTAPGFVTPSFLRTYYGMNPTSLYQGNIANYQAVYSTKNEYLSSNDLTTFQTRNRLPIQSVSNAASGLPTTNILANACQTTDCAEPNLGKLPSHIYYYIDLYILLRRHSISYGNVFQFLYAIEYLDRTRSMVAMDYLCLVNDQYPFCYLYLLW